MSSEPLRMYALTRPLTFLAVATVRSSPLLAMSIASIRVDVSIAMWVAAFVATIVLVFALIMVERRCSTADLPYQRGLLIVGVSLSCGWMFFDTLLVLLGVILVQLISCFLALAPSAPVRYHHLVLGFYRHRMRQ
ncbi:MAG TPA: hypothetical protein VGV14_13045 [Rhodanobacter sp.]|nr:hypothetical protein [Rhodanobacter sp.]